MKIAKAAFTDVDKDGSGEIDSDELGKIMLKISEQMGACPPSKEELEQFFKDMEWFNQICPGLIIYKE